MDTIANAAPRNDNRQPGMSSHKAWMAGLGAAVLPIVLQNVFGATASFSTLWDWFAHAAFGTAAVPPEAVAGAFKTLAAGLMSGIGTGLATWWIANKPKPPATSNEEEQHA